MKVTGNGVMSRQEPKTLTKMAASRPSDTIRPSGSTKRCILFKSLACCRCLIRDSLDTSAKVGLVKWRFSLFSSVCDAQI